MTVKRFFLLSALMVSVSATVAADLHFRTDARIARAHDLVYKLRFDEARQLLARVRSTDADNLSIGVEEVNILFMEALVSEEAPRKRSFDQQAAKYLDLVSRASEGPMKGFAIASVNLQSAVLAARAGDYWDAAWSLRSSHSASKRNAESYPTFVPDDGVFGVTQCILGAVPSEYEWLLSAVGMGGSTRLGRSVLRNFLFETAKEQYAGLRCEAVWYLSFLQSALYSDTPPEPNLLQLLAVESANSDLLLYAYTGILFKNGGNELVISLLESHRYAEGVFPMHGLRYRLGIAYLRNSDRRCIVDFNAYLDHFKGGSLKKAACQKIAWMHLLDGDLKGYRSAMHRCTSVGTLSTDEDKAAQQEAVAGPVPQTDLLKARLAYDGGYFQRAMSIVSAIDAARLSRDEKLELVYRTARIRQALGQEESAMAGYRIAIRAGMDSRTHFAANSALQLGLLFEKRSQPDSASDCYRLCLSMPDHDYKNSIDQKAKAALERVGSKD